MTAQTSSHKASGSHGQHKTKTKNHREEIKKKKKKKKCDILSLGLHNLI